MRRSFITILGGALTAAFLCLGGCSPTTAKLDDFGAVAKFSLKNQEGQTVSLKDLAGKTWVAAFIFTRCAGPCAQVSGHMAQLQQELARQEDVLLLSFTVDPEFDNPSVLKDYAARYGVDPKRWYFLTGDKKEVYDLIRGSFHLGVEESRGAEHKPGNEVTHSTKLALVDGNGRIRGYFDGTDAGQLKKLRQAVADLSPGEAMIRPENLPDLNAFLNGLSAVLLTAGYLAIKRHRVAAHKACMLAALVVSTTFLASYLYYHLVVKGGEPTRFTGEGWVRPIYFTVLLSHTVLAAAVAPLAVFTAYQGLRGNLARHVRVARWTWPLWLYVSVTGVVVYWMLYHLYP
jgi:protein SCO1